MKKLLFNMESNVILDTLKVREIGFKLGSSWDVIVGDNKEKSVDVLVTDNTYIAHYSSANFILIFLTDKNKKDGQLWKGLNVDKPALVVSTYDEIYKICKGLI